MAKAISGISNDTKRQLRWTQDHHIPIGAMTYWNSIGEKTPIYLNYYGNEQVWEEMEQISISQNEFSSLDIGYMFYKDPTLSKNNPYIYKDAWVNFGKNAEGEVVKKPLAAFQQLWHDRINCKIIADGETIDAIRALKRYEDASVIVYIFDKIEKYGVELNVPKRQRRIVYSTRGNFEMELTNIEDYDQEWVIEDNWKEISRLHKEDKEWHANYAKIEAIEKRIAEYESKVDPAFEKFAKVLINAYPALKMYQAFPENIWQLDPRDLYNDMGKLARTYQATYTSIWQTWYVKEISRLKKECKDLEELLL